jgi:predicted transcriptional regulator
MGRERRGTIPVHAGYRVAALGRGRAVDEVALNLLASSVDHDEWFRRELENGPTSAREGRLVDYNEVADRIDNRDRG